MDTYASYISKQTEEGLKIFRYSTEFRSPNGSGDTIGLVVMMNPGLARPMSDELFKSLSNNEFETEGLVLTEPDRTMKKVIRLIKSAYDINNILLPSKYTIQVENLFNIREENSNKAKKLANRLTDTYNVMFKSRELNKSYNFVFLAWGNVDINIDRQRELFDRYPDAIKVHKDNHKGIIRDVNYPVHPLYMNTDYFLRASLGKIRV